MRWDGVRDVLFAEDGISGEGVDAGGGAAVVAVATQVVGAECVHGNENDIHGFWFPALACAVAWAVW